MVCRQTSFKQPRVSSVIPIVPPTLETLSEAGEKLSAAEEKPPAVTRSFSRARSHKRSASFAQSPLAQPPAASAHLPALAEDETDAVPEDSPGPEAESAVDEDAQHAAAAAEQLPADKGPSEGTGIERQLTPSMQDMLRADSTALTDTQRGRDLLSATVADQAGLQEVGALLDTCTIKSGCATVIQTVLPSSDKTLRCLEAHQTIVCCSIPLRCFSIGNMGGLTTSQVLETCCKLGQINPCAHYHQALCHQLCMLVPDVLQSCDDCSHSSHDQGSAICTQR